MGTGVLVWRRGYDGVSGNGVRVWKPVGLVLRGQPYIEIVVKLALEVDEGA